MKKSLDLYLFIDALGWALVSEFHFCRDLLPVRYKVRTQFGYSSGAVPTILSGKTPAEHGHFSCFYYSPETSPFRWMKFLPLAVMPDRIFNRHRVKHQLAKIIRSVKGYTGYFELYQMPYEHLPYLDYTEKRDIFVPGGLEKVKNLADVWTEQKRAWHISNWRLSSERNLALAEEAAASETVDSMFVYTAEMDSFLHFHVSDKAMIATRLKEYEARIARLLDTARRHYKEVRFCMFSDHGMTPLRGTADLAPAIRKTGLTFGQDYVSVLDSTMARLWYLKPGVRETLETALAGHYPGHFLSEQEKSSFGIAFPDNQYGDAIFLLDPGIQIAPSDMGTKPLPGMHGFTPDDPDSDAACLSTGEPSVRPAFIGDFFKIMKAQQHVDSEEQC